MTDHHCSCSLEKIEASEYQVEVARSGCSFVGTLQVRIGGMIQVTRVCFVFDSHPLLTMSVKKLRFRSYSQLGVAEASC